GPSYLHRLPGVPRHAPGQAPAGLGSAGGAFSWILRLGIGIIFIYHGAAKLFLTPTAMARTKRITPGARPGVIAVSDPGFRAGLDPTRHSGYPSSHVPGSRQLLFRDAVVRSGRTRTVGVAACREHHLVGVAGRGDDAPPVVERVVHRQDGGLLAAVG